MLSPHLVKPASRPSCASFLSAADGPQPKRAHSIGRAEKDPAAAAQRMSSASACPASRGPSPRRPPYAPHRVLLERSRESSCGVKNLGIHNSAWHGCGHRARYKQGRPTHRPHTSTSPVAPLCENGLQVKRAHPVAMLQLSAQLSRSSTQLVPAGQSASLRQRTLHRPPGKCALPVMHHELQSVSLVQAPPTTRGSTCPGNPSSPGWLLTPSQPSSVAITNRTT